MVVVRRSVESRGGFLSTVCILFIDVPSIRSANVCVSTDTRYIDKIRYNDNLTGMKPSLKR